MIKKFFVPLLSFVFWSPLLQSHPMHEEEKIGDNTHPSLHNPIATDDLEALYTQGLFYRDHPDQDPGHVSAMEKFRKVLELDTTHVKAMHNLAALYFKLKDSQKAKEWFQKAADLGFEPSQRNLAKIEDLITVATRAAKASTSSNAPRVDTAPHKTASSLREAIISEDLESMNELITRGINVNEKDANGWPPLFYAVRTGKLELINLLITNGADVTLVDNFGASALHFSVMGNNAEVIATLVTAGAKVNAIDSRRATALHVAVATGSKEAINALIKAGADVHAKDCEGNTPLEVARKQGNTEIVRAFREASTFRK